MINGNDIQVCCYEGIFPNHNELDSWFVSTKKDAYQSISNDRLHTFKKWGVIYNYRIVDWLNRFRPIFYETKKSEI